MPDESGPALSVRGYARQTVPPDFADVFCSLETVADSKAGALRNAAISMERIIVDLAALGGVTRTADTWREALTWTARTGSHAEHKGERLQATGRVTATVGLLITVRDFGVLDGLDAALAGHEMLNLHHVAWGVDADNPAWPQVRASAIHAAIRQGHDYAAALNGSLLRVEHIADGGLLGGSAGVGHGDGGSPMIAMAASQASAGAGGPSLDPVPQELTATIEARFRCTDVSLPGQ